LAVTPRRLQKYAAKGQITKTQHGITVSSCEVFLDNMDEQTRNRLLFIEILRIAKQTGLTRAQIAKIIVQKTKEREKLKAKGQNASKPTPKTGQNPAHEPRHGQNGSKVIA